MGLIFYASHQPGEEIHLPDIDYIDKILHGFIYGILALSLRYTLVLNQIQNPFQKSLMISSLYGLSDEFHQVFIPGRTFELMDWAADTCGAILFLFLLETITKFKSRVSQNRK